MNLSTAAAYRAINHGQEHGRVVLSGSVVDLIACIVVE